MKKVPKPEDVIRIVAEELPTTPDKGDGLYEWRWCTDKYYLDFVDLGKEIDKVMPGRSEEILERLQNFRKVFLILNTGEVFT